MKVNNCTTPMFRGYKNIIADDIKGSDFRITHITMQLDDSVEKDLSKWKTIRKHFSQKQIPEFEDIISLISIQDCSQKKYLLLNDRSLPFGDELAHERAKSIGTKKEKAYLEKEKVAIKAYTLLASLTRRLMQGAESDGDFYNRSRVLSKIYFSLSRMLNVENTGFLLSRDLSKSPEKVAQIFNNMIDNTMRVFFK